MGQLMLVSVEETCSLLPFHNSGTVYSAITQEGS